MRHSLKQSLKDTPASGFERYPKGSIVLCNACSLPVAKLDYGIALGDKAGRMAGAFKPLTTADLDTLLLREDIDAGVHAWVRSLTPDARKTYLAKLHEYRAGDPMLCPLCQGCFVQVLSVEKNEVLDRAYVIELVTVAPQGQKSVAVRGKQLGTTKGKSWLHDGATVLH